MNINMSNNWTKLRRYLAGKPSKTGMEAETLPTRKTPIECTLGKMMIRMNAETGGLEYMGEINQGEYIKLDHSDLKNIKDRMEELEQENRLLKLKNEILLDLLSSTTLDAKYMEQTLLKIKNEGIPKQSDKQVSEEKNKTKKEKKKVQETKQEVSDIKKVASRRKQSVDKQPVLVEQ
ncbi:hypothetical protein C9374_013381 [Naegleria lovaniensis]|uniref:Uncharacterized protein n=1 Tax=Naegleria lovaniensis TaxID=51637 RepID=A0AA88KPW3_NAELO|nr:uncharacterized protein C9374_013381 [Naegleria lovaniensis]KAG2391896.1 hypothetical protein C9374_013381 [Naegleria lovaniensis]